MKFLLIPLALTFSLIAFSQDTTDVYRLKNLSYMKYADKVKCKGDANSNLEIRVCLNLEFQKVDAVMNKKFNLLLEKIETDSTRQRQKEFHQNWIEERRFQAKFVSEGMRGHLLGIVYLNCMVRMTNRRIEDIDFLLEAWP